MTSETRTQEFKRFLKALDESKEVEVSDWEAQFIASNMEAESFSVRQRTAIEKMIAKYGRRIGY